MAKASAAAAQPLREAGRTSSATRVAPPIRIGIWGWIEACPSHAAPASAARRRSPRWIEMNVSAMPRAAKTPDQAK